TGLPKNLIRLHAEEERIRHVSLDQVASEPELPLHIEAIEASLTVFLHFATNWPSDDIDKRTIQHLGLRLCNTTTGSFKLAMAGNHQGAAMLARDLIETGLLLDLLRTKPHLIAVWREAETRRERDPFQPVKVREALDERDGFTEKNREKHYRVLSTYAAHPHP